ncbi:phage antirepressor N-terminal domain-containing protein [[Clostridium] innocuum]|uniref:phage antirepressor N-terminal domain-containing protein n=1 Tax=Clostridium innocuum TaxID=1522 RepID=UPI003A4E279D
MTELEIKKVDFYDSELIGVQETTTGKVFTAINNVLRGIGFDEKQIEYQRNRMVNDVVLGKGTLKFSGTELGLNTGKDTWCIDIMKLPLALAKINITPKIRKENPQLAEMLELYQDKCAEVLAESFFKKHTDFIKSYSAKATSAGEVASLIKPVVRVMEKQGSRPYKVAQQTEKTLNQFGIETIPDFVELPKNQPSEQLSFEATLSITQK